MSYLGVARGLARPPWRSAEGPAAGSCGCRGLHLQGPRQRPSLHFGAPPVANCLGQTQGQFNCSWRPSTRRKAVVTHSLFDWGRKAQAPRPNEAFTKKDMRRIKEEGPMVEDVVISAVQEYEQKDSELLKEDVVYAWVPQEVLGDGVKVAEPSWSRLPQKTYLEFYNGLQRRNWTSTLHDPSAEPWKVTFFQDNGRLLGPSFTGYRAVVTPGNGRQFWVDMPKAGAETWTSDHLAGGTKGGIWRAKRLPKPPQDISDLGYNQVFEELFQAYQQRIPAKAEQQYYKERWVDQDSIEYDCPGHDALNVEFISLPSSANVPLWVANNAPRYFIFTSAISFLFVVLYLAIFKPRKGMPSDAHMAIEFAQSKGQARQEGKTGIKFSDVAGVDKTLQDLQEIVEFLKNPKKYLALGTKPPKGVLLEGEPGTGKTLIAKAMAGEAGVPFYQMSGSEFVEAIVGVGAARVRDLFKRARVQESPCIIFVDEIDAVGARRADASEKTNEEREQTLNQLLSEMDGFTPDLGVVFVAATNRSDMLDPALLRAGRFDKKFIIPRPDTQGRYDILKVHARDRPLAGDVDLMQIARDLPGLSGAELANVLNEGALETARRDGNQITTLDIYNGIDRILEGVRRPGLPARMAMRRRLALHEMGKALVATVLRQRYLAAGREPHLEQVERVTIVPRGREWTRTVFLRGEDEDYTMATRSRLLDRLRVILAGRAAEEVMLPEGPTTYGRQGLADATTLAQKIVANYGLSAVGITMYAPPGRPAEGSRSNYEVSVDKIDEDLFGRGVDGGMYQASDLTMTRIRKTAQALVRECYADDLGILRWCKAALEAATDSLLEKETLSGNELEIILQLHPEQEPEEQVEQEAWVSTEGNGSGNGNGNGNWSERVVYSREDAALKLSAR